MVNTVISRSNGFQRTNNFFSRVLRDSTLRFVSPSICPFVRLSVHPSRYSFGVNGVFGQTAPAQMLH